jgi:hypothetical protein
MQAKLIAARQEAEMASSSADGLGNDDDGVTAENAKTRKIKTQIVTMQASKLYAVA